MPLGPPNSWAIRTSLNCSARRTFAMCLNSRHSLLRKMNNNNNACLCLVFLIFDQLKLISPHSSILTDHLESLSCGLPAMLLGTSVMLDKETSSYIHSRIKTIATEEMHSRNPLDTTWTAAGVGQNHANLSIIVSDNKLGQHLPNYSLDLSKNAVLPALSSVIICRAC